LHLFITLPLSVIISCKEASEGEKVLNDGLEKLLIIDGEGEKSGVDGTPLIGVE
jgi:hypothetical protein